MKKLVCAMLCACMTLCLVSCGGEEEVSSPAPTSSADKDIILSEYTPSDIQDDPDKQGSEYSVTRYYICEPGGKKKATADVDYSETGTITVNFFDVHNYKTGSAVYDYDENGLVMRAAQLDKSGKELSYTLYDYNNLQKLDTEYYYENDALRSTARYTYNENGILTEKTVDNVGDDAVYTWVYQNENGHIYAINITNNKNSDTEGYNLANNTDGKLYQKQHIVKGFSDDYYMYDYDDNGSLTYRGYFNKSNSLVEYYSFTYKKVDELAAKAFLNSGILD